MLKGIFAESLCWVRIEEIDEGKAVTGTNFEVHCHVDEIKLNAEKRVGDLKPRRRDCSFRVARYCC